MKLKFNDLFDFGPVIILAVSLWIFCLGKVSEAIFFAILANSIRNISNE